MRVTAQLQAQSLVYSRCSLNFSCLNLGLDQERLVKLEPASFIIFRERRGRSGSAWSLTLVSPGLGSLVNFSPPQGRFTHGRGGASLVFPTLGNNNPLQPFQSSTLSAKQQNWRLLKPGGGGIGRVGRTLGSKLRQPSLPPRSPPPIISRLQNGSPKSPPWRAPQKCELFPHQSC